MRPLDWVELLLFFCFNPRICKRCDQLFLFLLLLPFSFNPRICKRCDFWVPVLVAHLFCFNPRICKRCDCCFIGGFFCCHVSIHASVKDATPSEEIFFLYCCFNPRICKRCDIYHYTKRISH